MSRIMESDFDCGFYMQIVNNSTKDKKKSWHLSKAVNEYIPFAISEWNSSGFIVLV